MSGIVGGAFAYLTESTRRPIWPTSPRDGHARRDEDAPNRGRGRLASRAASLELGYKDSPLSLATDWDAGRGGLYGERYGMKYRLRY